MLACARIGAVHSVVFGGFAAHELATRIDDAARVMVAASCGIEPSRHRAVQAAARRGHRASKHKPEHCIILQREQGAGDLVAGRDIDWTSVIGGPSRPLRAGGGHRPAVHPLHLRHHRPPKGVVRDNGGHAVALAWSMSTSTASSPGEVYWAASDVGWVVGHSYIVYAPAAARLHHHRLRGQAGGHPGCRAPSGA
jgi:propionyl-CoA synthetase